MADWRWAMACEPGTRHVADGRRCDDAALAMGIEGPTGPVAILVVADGAGSSRFAHIASKLAVRGFAAAARTDVGHLTDPPSTQALRGWLGAARKRLELLAELSNQPLGEFSTTLLACVLAEDWAGFVQIGDGAIVCESDEEGEWGWMFPPHRGVYANETTFLTHPDAKDLAHACVSRLVPGEVALFTDGLENLLIREGAERRVVDAFFNEMMVPVRGLSEAGGDGRLSSALSAYLGSDAINARTDDDKTLILATRRAVAGHEACPQAEKAGAG